MEGYRGREVWRCLWATARISKALMQAFSTETTLTSAQEGQVPEGQGQQKDDLPQHGVSKVLLKPLLPAAQGPICKKPTFDMYRLDSMVFAGSFQLPKGLWGIILIKWTIVL